MKKMLDISILENDIKYNDDIAYVEGDDIFNKTLDISHTSYTNSIDYENYILDKLGSSEYSPMIEHFDYKNQTADMTYCTCLVKGIIIHMNNEILSDFDNVIIDYNDEISDEMFNLLQYDRYDGIRYYAHTDTLMLPQVFKQKLDNNESFEARISVYNYDKAIKKHNIFNFDVIADRPRLEYQYIPETIKHSVLTETKYGHIESPKEGFSSFTYLYLNLPREYYKYITIDNNTLVYDIDEKIFYGHSNSNQTKINTLCKDMAENGIKKVIQLKLYDGKLISCYSNKRLLNALYLNAPSIPVCIVISESYRYDYNNYYNGIENKDALNELLKPYIMIP